MDDQFNVICHVLMATFGITLLMWFLTIKLGSSLEIEIKPGMISYIVRLSLVPLAITTAIYATVYGGILILIMGVLASVLFFVVMPLLEAILLLTLILPIRAYECTIEAFRFCFTGPK